MSVEHPDGVDRFHDKRGACPHCGNTAAPFNKSLKTGALNRQLYGQVERQQNEVSFAKKALKEKAPR